jgi:hypothetical protein
MERYNVDDRKKDIERTGEKMCPPPAVNSNQRGLPSFTSTDRMEKIGVGTVFAVRLAEDDPVISKGDHVIIDGTEYEVSGVEMAWTLMVPPRPLRNIGLVVREVEAQADGRA